MSPEQKVKRDRADIKERLRSIRTQYHKNEKKELLLKHRQWELRSERAELEMYLSVINSKV